MGRMAKMMRGAEQDRAEAPIGIVDAPFIEPDPEPEPEVEPDPEVNDEVSFVEVGRGPRTESPSLRLISPPAKPLVIAAPAPAAASPPPTLPIGVFSIRFQPVHAGRLRGRGFGPEIVAYHQPDHTVAVQYRSLLAEVVTQLPGSNPRVLLFVGAAPEAGTSTVLVNLAVTLARQGEIRVTAVDGHDERPALATKLGLVGAPGWREVMSRHTPLAWALQETMQPNLLALPAGKPAARGDESSSAVLEQMRQRSDWVLVDGGVWGDNAAALAEGCDAVYLVVRQDESAKAETLQSAILEASGRLRGCVVTQR